MEGNAFVTTRGDRISLAFGRRPTVGRTGSGPYPRVDEVSEGSELVGDFHLSFSQIVREARRNDVDPRRDGFGHHNPNLNIEDDLFYNSLAVDRVIDVRATLLFGSQCAVSVCLCYPIPVGHCQ